MTHPSHNTQAHSSRLLILVVEDEATLGRNICAYLERYGYVTQHVESAEAAVQTLEVNQPAVILLDYHLPGKNGLELFQSLQKLAPEAITIMMTGHGTVELAVEAMKLGADDFLTKPISLAKVKLLIERGLENRRQAKTLHYYQQKQVDQSQLEQLIGHAAPMLHLKQQITQILQNEARLQNGIPPAILITGETGTGKELVARALHFGGPRAKQAFVELNCAAIPANLLESELFGHERGAFTDAKERKTGLVETAEGGTLFLDEIGDMDPSLQAKLLKLLEEKTMRRIGSTRDQQVDVRIIAATHRSLAHLVASGQFRADLYYRLRIIELCVPPLRERAGDIAILAKHFLAWHGRRYGRTTMRLDPAASQRLNQHLWPGNVRELRNLMEQVVMLAQDDLITPDMLQISPLSQAFSQNIFNHGEASIADAPVIANSRELATIERNALLQALQQTQWNISQAARLLGISRDTLRYRIEKYQLHTEGPNFQKA